MRLKDTYAPAIVFPPDRERWTRANQNARQHFMQWA